MDPELIITLVIVLFVIGLPVLLFLMAWLVGATIEKRHFQSIRERESKFLQLPAVPIRTPDPDRTVMESRLVTGSVVVSNDRFKLALAGLRMIFGGRVASYESLVDRARREAILRMKAEWPEADAILNLRMETSTISTNQKDRGMGAFEVLAYGTAIRYQ